MIESLMNTVSSYVSEGNMIAYFLVYIAGILASFTPCMYPVIPLTVAYFSAQGKKTKRQTAFLAVVYVVGMSTVYSILGMIAALTGSIFGMIATHPVTLFVFANVCILFGLVMMDALSIPLPQFLTAGAGGKRRGGVIGSFLLGCSAGLVVGPCTTPILAILLTYVGTKQSVFFGASLLFVFSLGMGTLLIVLGLFSGLVSRLPKSGTWLVWVKKCAGLIMIGVGEFFLVEAGKMLF